MEAPISDQQIISIAVLERLINNLPPSALATFPIEQLPDNIPIHLVTSAPEEIAEILETMLLEHQQFMLNIRRSIKNNLGAKGLSAYELAQYDFQTGPLTSIKSKLHEYRAYKRYFSFEQEAHGAARLLTLLEEQQKSIETIHRDFDRLKHAITILQPDTALAEPLRSRIQKAHEQIKVQLEEHSSLLNQYFTERLALCVSIMTGHTDELEHQLSHWNSLKEQALVISTELDESERLLSPKLYRSATIERPGHHPSLALDSLRNQLSTIQLPYGEDDLTHWMDVLVDYHEYIGQDVGNDPLFQKAKKHIQRLLSYHFESNFISSLSLSSSEKINHDAQKLQGFMGKSQAYLENYLKERQRDVSISALS